MSLIFETFPWEKSPVNFYLDEKEVRYGDQILHTNEVAAIAHGARRMSHKEGSWFLMFNLKLRDRSGRELCMALPGSELGPAKSSHYAYDKLIKAVNEFIGKRLREEILENLKFDVKVPIGKAMISRSVIEYVKKPLFRPPKLHTIAWRDAVFAKEFDWVTGGMGRAEPDFEIQSKLNRRLQIRFHADSDWNAWILHDFLKDVLKNPSLLDELKKR